MPEADRTLTTPARCPPSPRPAGLPPVPPPEPWQPASAPAKPSRRGVMFTTAQLFALGGAMAGVSPATAAVPNAGDPDAELVAMCARIVAAHDEMERLESPYYDCPSSPPEVQARTALLVAEGHRLAEAAAEVHAVTPEGVRAKARAMLTYACMTLDGTPDWSNHSDLLGWSIARDLLRGA